MPFVGLVLMIGLVASRAAAAWDWDGAGQVHGFLTQGYTHTSDNRFYGDSEDGSFEFTEIGINGSYRAMPSLLLAGQLLSRRAGDLYDGSPTIDYALLDWNAINSPQQSIGLRLGRIKNPLGFYNDTRDVAFTRPSNFLPRQVYFDNVRNLVLAADGAQAYGRWFGEHGNWGLVLGAGRSNIDENVEISFLGRDWAGEIDSDSLLSLARLEYETPGSGWRLALSGATGRLEFEPGAGDPLGAGDIDFLYWIASVQYNAERWSLTAEYMEEPVDYRGFGPLRPDGRLDVQGYYLQGSYLLRDNVELLLRYTEGFTDKHDRDGKEQSAATGGLIPPHNFYQKDWVLGLRWDVTPSLMLRAEYQWSDGTWGLARRENPNAAATVEDWEMFSVQAAYRF